MIENRTEDYSNLKAYLTIEPFSYELCEIFLYRAFFDNICFHLENGKWGSRFPVIMKCLYNGEVKFEELEAFQIELDIIKTEFLKIDVKKIIWDIENLDVKCPYLDNMGEEIKTIADFWKTSYLSEDMFDFFAKTIIKAKEDSSNIEVEIF